jgi:hypothetical protein
MWRLLRLTALSVGLYITTFGFLVDRPLSIGLLNLEINQKALRLSALASPKIVIIAGSNGPYSHSCVVIGAMLGMPCENAGIAVGIGLDFIFADYGARLRPGDIVYMPMETAQYVTTRAEDRSGADAEILLHDHRVLLAALPLDRILGAVFCCTLGDLIESTVEMPVASIGVIAPARILSDEYNREGDRIDAPLAGADTELLWQASRVEPDAAGIDSGYGTALIRAFVADESHRGVVVIGGLPTDFSTERRSPAAIAAVAAVYESNAGKFMILSNQSEYPIGDFFNSEDHLAQPCQYLHSILVAQGLGRLIGRQPHPPGPAIINLAVTCPSYQAISAALWPAIRAQASASSSSKSSASLRIMVPPSSSASTMVTARR